MMTRALAATLLLLSALKVSAETGSVFLYGIVNPTYSIQVQTEPAAGHLNILSGENLLKIASVTERSNSANGYKILISSARGGRLVNEVAVGAELEYQVSYGGTALVSPTSIATPVKISGALTEPANQVVDVAISFQGKPNALAGTYSDTLTFEISAP
jgi:hypothetical protein